METRQPDATVAGPASSPAPFRFEGTYVTLRPLVPDDAEVTLGWRLSERARRFLQRGSRTVEEQRAWIQGRQGRGEVNCIMEHQGTAVGMIALHDINPIHRSAILGRLLVGEPEVVGRAPVTFESERLLLDHAFDTLGLHKIYGDIVADNVAMIRTRAYLGYHQDGVMREHYNFDGEFKDAIMISLLEDEYRSVCRPRLTQLIDIFGRSARA